MDIPLSTTTNTGLATAIEPGPLYPLPLRYRTVCSLYRLPSFTSHVRFLQLYTACRCFRFANGIRRYLSTFYSRNHFRSKNRNKRPKEILIREQKLNPRLSSLTLLSWLYRSLPPCRPRIPAIAYIHWLAWLITSHNETQVFDFMTRRVWPPPQGFLFRRIVKVQSSVIGTHHSLSGNGGMGIQWVSPRSFNQSVPAS